MWKDPIIAELHEIRQQMLAQCDGDLRKYSAMVHAQAAQRRAAEALRSTEGGGAYAVAQPSSFAMPFTTSPPSPHSA